MSAPLTLYALAREYQALEALLAEAEEAGQDLQSREVSEIVLRWFNALDGNLVERVTRCVAVINEQKALKEMTAAEIKKLEVLKKRRESRVERLQSMIEAVLVWAQLRHVDTPLGTVRIKGNGGVAPMQVDDVDPAEIAQQWPDLVVVTTTINAAAVRERLQRGESLPFARLMPRDTHLEIR